ncbi:SIMPL domain-containing protein [Chloroflexota bacterium]
MNKTKILAIGLALIIAIAALAGCTPQNTVPVEISGLSINSQQEGIWVNGQGAVLATPDIATLRLGVEVQAISVESARTIAAEAMDEIMEALADEGISEKDIQTQYYNIRQITRWDRDKEEEEVTGYRVSNTVTAKIREIENAGIIIDAIASAGGDLTRIDSINFSVEDPTEYYEAAREAAVDNAKAKAEQLAELAGARLDKVTYISESSQSIPIYRQDVSYEFEEALPAASTSISPGEMEINLNIQVGYSLLY